MPRLALVSYPVLLFCTVLPPCFILLRCFFCRLVLFRCGAFLPPRFTLLRCLFCRFVLLRCGALSCRFVLLRCGALSCRLALLRCPTSSCRFALPRYHASLTALSCGLVRPPCLSPPSCLSYRLVWFRCLAPFYDLASSFLTPLHLFFSSLKNDFPYPLPLSLPLLRGALMFYSSGFAVY